MKRDLAQMLRAASLTQAAVADSLGRSLPRVSRVVNGVDVPDVGELRALARLLKCETKDIAQAWSRSAMRTAERRAAELAKNA